MFFYAYFYCTETYTSMALSVNRGMCSRLCLLQFTTPWGLGNRQICPFVTAAVTAITTNTNMLDTKKRTQGGYGWNYYLISFSRAASNIQVKISNIARRTSKKVLHRYPDRSNVLSFFRPFFSMTMCLFLLKLILEY